MFKSLSIVATFLACNSLVHASPLFLDPPIIPFNVSDTSSSISSSSSSSSPSTSSSISTTPSTFPTFFPTKIANGSIPASVLNPPAMTADLDGGVVSQASPIPLTITSAAELPGTTSSDSGAEATSTNAAGALISSGVGPASSEGGGLGEATSIPSYDFGPIAAKVSMVASLAAAELASASGLIDLPVPVNTASAAPSTITATITATDKAQASAVPAVVSPSAGNLVGLLLDQVNNFLRPAAESRVMFPASEPDARDARECEFVMNYMKDHLSSAITSNNGTWNISSLHFTGTTNGTFVVKDSDVQLVTYKNSSLAFQLFTSTSNCGPIKGASNSTIKRGGGDLGCFLHDTVGGLFGY